MNINPEHVYRIAKATVEDIRDIGGRETIRDYAVVVAEKALENLIDRYRWNIVREEYDMDVLLACAEMTQTNLNTKVVFSNDGAGRICITTRSINPYPDCVGVMQMLGDDDFWTNLSFSPERARLLSKLLNDAAMKKEEISRIKRWAKSTVKDTRFIFETETVGDYVMMVAQKVLISYIESQMAFTTEDISELLRDGNMSLQEMTNRIVRATDRTGSICVSKWDDNCLTVTCHWGGNDKSPQLVFSNGRALLLAKLLKDAAEYHAAQSEQPGIID